MFRIEKMTKSRFLSKAFGNGVSIILSPFLSYLRDNKISMPSLETFLRGGGGRSRWLWRRITTHKYTNGLSIREKRGQKLFEEM